MRYRLLLSVDATTDLKTAYAWSRRHYPLRLEQSRTEIRTLLAEIREAPLLWTLWRAPDYRRRLLPHLPYAIVYHVIEQTIVIDAIVHQSQDTTRRFPEDP